ncbi:PAS domain-containing sensor histidine kinase [Anoxybacterium hadale]|uniref:PAS domain-containing sensor histidine kinase n=1 Tax=Anoxybacterium hadale TaxID=3408580 RepID=A0ACD1AG55_9FIRM|nr:PAS domain-containing sensor histidine kinase [Clostridiales bacterium]
MGVYYQQDNDQFYDAFFKNSVTAMLIIDYETLKIVDANYAACKFYKYSYQEFLKLKITDLNTLRSDQVYTQLNLAASHVKNSFTFKHKLSTGEIKNVLVNSGVVNINQKNYIHTIVFDITDREVSLKPVSQMQAILDNLPFVAWFKDLQGRYMAINKSFEDQYGCLKENVVGKYDFEIFTKAQADTFLFGDIDIITKKKKVHFEEKNENGRWNEVYKSPVYNEYGNIIGTTGITRDITDKKLQEKALHDAGRREMLLLQETIELKDNFITLITHEFKTPIAIINAAIQTMEIVCKDDITAKMKNYLNKIKQNSLRQQRLVDNLLDITRLKAGRMKSSFTNVEIVSFTNEIVESVKLYADQKLLRLTFQSSCKTLMVSTDIEKYERIILNLLSNAIKFTPANKSINVILYKKGSYLKVDIKDKGIGIPDDKKSIIFERFGQADTSLTRQAEGTGIGLYLVKLMVDNLGGTIDVSSEVDYGSTFSISLPLQLGSPKKAHVINESKILQATSLEFSDIIL